MADSSIENKGIIDPNKTHYGIITHTDGEYNYVWAPHLETLELRYPLNMSQAFQGGDIVRFVQTKDGRGPQVVHDLVKAGNDNAKQNEIVREKTKDGLDWKMKTKLVFAPPTNPKLLQMQQINERVCALAWSDDLMEVISFKKIDFEPGIIYMGYVRRLPCDFTSLGKKLGSLFCIKLKGTQLTEMVSDPEVIREFMAECPFREEMSPTDDEIGLPILTGPLTNESTSRSSNEQRVQPLSRGSHDNGYSMHNEPNVCEGAFKNYAERLAEAQEGIAELGLIVRTEKEYSVIWSPKHDLVRAQMTGADENDKWALCSWVKYRCFAEQSQLHHGMKCNYTAYDISSAMHDEHEVRTCENEMLGKEVIIKAFLINAQKNNSQLFHAYDAFLGKVLCPIDHRLMDKFRNENGDSVEVEVWAIFTEQYESRWMAFAFNDHDQLYNKLQKLPPMVDSKISGMFDRVGSRTHQSAEEHFQSQVGAGFQPPNGWNGPIQSGNKIVDVLGVTLVYEQGESVTLVATLYGIARQPKKMDLGTWVKATIEAEEDQTDNPTYQSFLNGTHSYRILRSEKISPPISTRVIEAGNAKKLLLCGDVMAGALGLINEYLGRVVDKSNLIPMVRSGSSHLVEIGLCREPDDRRKCFWKVLKYHGCSVKNVHKVPLAMSYHPNSEGKTCDDAHTILLEKVFDLEEYSRQKEKGNIRKNIRNYQSGRMETSLGQPPLLSGTKESIENLPLNSCSTREFFATTSAYQQPSPPSNFKSVQHQHFVRGDSSKKAEKDFANSHATYNTPRDLGLSTINSDEEILLSQLDLYEISREKKRRANSIIVRKRPEYVLLFSRGYGLSIVLPKFADVQSSIEFMEKFTLGEFVLATFVKVADRQSKGLIYEWMCIGEFKPSENKLPTRVLNNKFVQIQIDCDFVEGNYKKCEDGKIIIETDVNGVLFENDILQQYDFKGKTVRVWATHIQEREGCHWQVVMCDRNSCLGDDDTPILAEFEVVRDRTDTTKMGPSRLLCPSPMNIVKTPLLPELNNHNFDAWNQSDDEEQEEPSHNQLYNCGYEEFLFGSAVPDGMAGEQYPDPFGDSSSDDDDYVNANKDFWDEIESNQGDSDDCRIRGGEVTPPLQIPKNSCSDDNDLFTFVDHPSICSQNGQTGQEGNTGKASTDLMSFF